MYIQPSVRATLSSLEPRNGPRARLVVARYPQTVSSKFNTLPGLEALLESPGREESQSRPRTSIIPIDIILYGSSDDMPLRIPTKCIARPTSIR